MKKGYIVKEIREVLEFEMKTRIFKDYVGSFLRMKQKASSFLTKCETEEQKREYIKKYEKHENVKMEYDFFHDPGLKYISKIFLNSLFGKCKRTDLTQTCVENNS